MKRIGTMTTGMILAAGLCAWSGAAARAQSFRAVSPETAAPPAAPAAAAGAAPGIAALPGGGLALPLGAPSLPSAAAPAASLPAASEPSAPWARKAPGEDAPRLGIPQSWFPRGDFPGGNGAEEKPAPVSALAQLKQELAGLKKERAELLVLAGSGRERPGASEFVGRALERASTLKFRIADKKAVIGRLKSSTPARRRELRREIRWLEKEREANLLAAGQVERSSAELAARYRARAAELETLIAAKTAQL